MPSESKKLLSINEIGKKELLDRIKLKFKNNNKPEINSYTTKASIINYSNQNTIVVNKLFNEGVHFNLVYFPLKHLGYKLVIATISELYAINTTPKQLIINISLSEKFSVQAIEEIFVGIEIAVNRYELDMISINFDTSLNGLNISITAIGGEKFENIINIKGAKNNDLICVTGDLGASYMGLLLLERENKVCKNNPSIKPEFNGYDYILERQLKPEARKDIKNQLQSLQINPTSMTLISEGLSSALWQLTNTNKLGCNVYEDKIPMDDQTQKMAQEFNINPVVAVLYGGEDYELLLTIPIEQNEKIKNNPDITVIGHVTESPTTPSLITTGNSIIEIKEKWIF